MKEKRIIGLFLCCCLLLPGLLYAQSSKTVTLDLKEVPVKVFFDAIRKQTGLSFVYNTEQTKAMKPITVSAKNETVESVLKKVFTGTEFSYQIEDKIVTIVKYEKSLGGGKRITGTVKDHLNIPMPGVNVLLQGTTVGCTTDLDGNYALDIPHDGGIVFTFIGMEPQTIQSKGKTEINVVLKEDTQMIDEVVVNGYFTKNKSSFTGNAVVVKKDELAKISTNNIMQALQVFDPSFRLQEDLNAGSNPNAVPV